MESLPPNVLVHLRHLALEASDESLSTFFDDRLRESFADRDSLELGAEIYSFLPGNFIEMHVVGELLRRMREDDPSIKPIVDEIVVLLKQRLDKEIEQLKQQTAQRLKPKLTLKAFAGLEQSAAGLDNLRILAGLAQGKKEQK